GEAAAVDAVVDLTVGGFADRFDLVDEGVGVQVGGAVALVGGPLELQVARDQPEVGGDDLAAWHVDDGGDGDAALVAGHRLLVRLAEPVDAEDRVLLPRVEVKLPGAPVVGRAADPHGQRFLKAEEAAGDHGTVGPRAAAGD